MIRSLIIVCCISVCVHAQPIQQTSATPTVDLKVFNQAVNDGDVDKVKSFLAQGADPDAIGPINGYVLKDLVPKYIAMAYQSVVALQPRVRKIADTEKFINQIINAKKKTTPIKFTLKIKRRSKSNATKNTTASNVSQDLFNQLMEAASSGTVADVKKCIDQGISPNSRGKYQGFNNATPLMLAISYNRNIDVIRYLIDNGADVNLQTETTPLIYAVALRDKGVVELLLNSGANPNTVVKGFSMMGMPAQTALQACSILFKDLSDIAQLLIQYGASVEDDTQAIINAMQFEAPATLKVLAAHGGSDFIKTDGEQYLTAIHNDSVDASKQLQRAQQDLSNYQQIAYLFGQYSKNNGSVTQ